MSERRPATTIAELDLHLSYVQRDLAEVSRALAAMATKADIQDILERMKTFATREELQRLRDQVEADKPSSRLKRWATVATHIMAIVGVASLLYAVFANGVRLADSVPAAKVAKP